MEGRKWEDLKIDCLVNVLGRVGMESLLLEIPFVCKSWYRATLDPLCWRRLDFPGLNLYPSCYNRFTSRLMEEYHIRGCFDFTRFIKSLVKRSDKSATYLTLPLFVQKKHCSTLLMSAPT